MGPQKHNQSGERILLGMILALFAAISVAGITWGLPGRKIDKYLFGDDGPWPGEKIHRLAGVSEKFSPDRGADVDVDPIKKDCDEPILLTATEEDVAKIYLRYRLYTYQPDEMITLMALAGMNPRRLRLDPRLYQYGGLFIYPVGALIAGCGLVGLIDVRSDIVYYLDHPDAFGKFYIVARAYSAAWGMVGVIVVFSIARRLGGTRAGLPAALLFTLMPVVVCMAHEGKPHLPGAVLMLMAVLFAMRHLSRRAVDISPRGGADSAETPRGLQPAAGDEGLERHGTRDWWFMCICCGAAFGMVLSSWPIFVLIPLVAWRAANFSTREFGAVAMRTIIGLAVAIGVYLITNPYLLINAFINREVLRSNFGNSLAMYEIARIGEGFVRVLELTVEGATLPVLVLGVIALIVAVVRKSSTIIPLAAPAAVFFLQFILIGAGKPAEYGRFGIFTNTALAIGTACLLARRWTRLREIVNWVPVTFIVLWVGLPGGTYLRNFYLDTTNQNSRWWGSVTPRVILDQVRTVALLAEPAPYGCPPLPFDQADVLLFPNYERAASYCVGRSRDTLFVRPVDRRGPSTWMPHSREIIRWRDLARFLADPRMANGPTETPISWANKPFEITGPRAREIPIE